MRHPLMSLPSTLLQDKCSGSEQGGAALVAATIVATDKEAKTVVVLFIAALFYRLSFKPTFLKKDANVRNSEKNMFSCRIQRKPMS